jgi:hypothetical protein
MVRILQCMVGIIEKTRIAQGTPVGGIAADSVSEPLTQLSLDSFHEAGRATSLSSGVPRVKEIINCSPTTTPSMRITWLTPEYNLVEVRFSSIVDYWTNVPSEQQCRDIAFMRSMLDASNVEVPLVQLVVQLVASKGISGAQVCQTISQHMELGLYLRCDPQGIDNFWFAVDIYPDNILKGTPKNATPEFVAMMVYERILHTMQSVTITGIRGITDVMVMRPSDRRSRNIYVTDSLTERSDTVTITAGQNIMEIFSNQHVDITRTHTNDVNTIYEHFGVCAAENAIFQELCGVMKAPVTRHVRLIANCIGATGKLCGFSLSGFLSARTSPLKLASFERVVDGFVRLAKNGHRDEINGMSEACLFGVKIKHGTGTKSSSIMTIKGMLPNGLVTAKNQRQLRAARNIFASIHSELPADILDTNGPIQQIHSSPPTPVAVICDKKASNRRKRQRDSVMRSTVLRQQKDVLKREKRQLKTMVKLNRTHRETSGKKPQ